MNAATAAPDATPTPEPERLAAEALLHAKAAIDTHRARLAPNPPRRREHPFAHIFQEADLIATR